MNAVFSAAAPPSPWRLPLIGLVLVWLFLGGLYADTVKAMVGTWNSSETFAHAFLVPPISAWLVWRRREALAGLVPQPQPWMLVGVLAFACMWLLSDLVVVNAGAQFAWVAMLALSVPALLGLRVAHIILFPLLFLFFAVPMGEFMLEPMMQWTADFTITALRFTGIPVYREGLQFVIPSGRWSVVEACSGVRYLIASFMVGTLFAYLNYNSWKRRAGFMLISIVVPIVANWVRAYMIVMIGHLSGNTLAVGVDHLIYGWVFFGVVIMIMFMIGARWSEPEAPVIAHGLLPGQAAAFPGNGAGPGRLIAGSMALLALLVLPHLVLAALHRQEAGTAAPRLTLPERLGATWVAVPTDLDYAPKFMNPSAELRQTYRGAEGEVHLFVAYYRGQTADSKLVSSVNVLVRSDEPRWIQVSSGSRLSPAGGQDIAWRTAEILGAEAGVAERARLTVWRTYWIAGGWVAGDIRAKMLGAFSRLRGGGDDGAVVVLWTNENDTARAEALLQSFAQDNLAAVQALLAQTHSAR
jgi:exosortase A